MKKIFGVMMVLLMTFLGNAVFAATPYVYPGVTQDKCDPKSNTWDPARGCLLGLGWPVSTGVSADVLLRLTACSTTPGKDWQWNEPQTDGICVTDSGVSTTGTLNNTQSCTDAGGEWDTTGAGYCVLSIETCTTSGKEWDTSTNKCVAGASAGTTGSTGSTGSTGTTGSVVSAGSTGGTSGSQVTGGTGGATGGTPCESSTALCNPIKYDKFSDFVSAVIKAAVQVLMPFVVLAFIYTGFLFVKAQGKDAEITAAKKSLRYSIIGAFILMGAWGFAQIISATVATILK